jgi:hypothetical protein
VEVDRSIWKWFHCTSHTYGAWLYGDPRGFRTRHHREHVEGDYKHQPAPGIYDDELARSRALLKQGAVVLPPLFRRIVGRAVLEMLQRLTAQVLCVSMSATHLHLLAKMPVGPVPRQWVGRAKKHSNFISKERGWTGKLWAVRGKVLPIADRQHQLNTFGYILRHLGECAWVWDFRNGESPGTAVPGL